MNYDEYKEVINGEKTYESIARELLEGQAVLIGWTDQNGTHLDILFKLSAMIFGSNIQGGVKNDDLFVSVMRWGSFGFVPSAEETHPGYIDEKLGNRASFGSTATSLAELINGVKKNLNL